MEFYEEYKRTGDTTSKHSVSKGNFSVLEYNFILPLYNLYPPWRSAMANGEALVPLIKAHQMTRDDKYLDTAGNLFDAFLVEAKHGGLTYRDSETEWWYEEYIGDNKDAKKSRVLNGMLFALLGIYQYYNYTGSNIARLAFERGVNGVEKNLRSYASNGYSYYDVLFNPAEKYHEIHVDLLNKLYDIAGKKMFKEFSNNKWASYEEPRKLVSETGKKHLGWNFLVICSIAEMSTLVASKLKNARP